MPSSIPTKQSENRSIKEKSHAKEERTVLGVIDKNRERKSSHERKASLNEKRDHSRGQERPFSAFLNEKREQYKREFTTEQSDLKPKLETSLNNTSINQRNRKKEQERSRSRRERTKSLTSNSPYKREESIKPRPPHCLNRSSKVQKPKKKASSIAPKKSAQDNEM